MGVHLMTRKVLVHRFFPPYRPSRGTRLTGQRNPVLGVCTKDITHWDDAVPTLLLTQKDSLEVRSDAPYRRFDYVLIP